MAEAVVRGVHINYEVIGASGPWIALTPGSRRSYAELRGLSAAIASTGYRVLLHDRRNCGASDVAFDGSGSEHEVWADDLHELGPAARRAAVVRRRLVRRRAARHPVRAAPSESAARPAVVASHRRTACGRPPGRELLRQVHQDRARGRHAGGVRVRAFRRMHQGAAGQSRASDARPMSTSSSR